MKRVNLLPRHKQTDIAHERAFYSVSVAVALSVAILLFGVLVQYGVGVYLERSTISVETQIEQLKRVANKSENAEVKLQIQAVNAQIGDFTNLLNATPQWSTVLEAFVSNVPAGIKITQFDADTEKMTVNISGYSPTRDRVIDLYNNINADKTHFKNINYPLENVTQPTEVRFNFTFQIADGILVEAVK